MRSRCFVSTLALSALGMFVCIEAGYAQAGGQQGGGQTGGGATTPSTPASPGGRTSPTIPSPGTQTPGRDNTQQQLGQPRNTTDGMSELQRPLYLSGKVVLDDGTPPPSSIVIELICGGQPRPQAYTDSKGRFSFQVGNNNAMLADASVSHGMSGPGGLGGGNRGSGSGMGSGMPGQGAFGEPNLAGCDLRAVLPGYRSEALPLAGRRVMDNPDVGTIILKRLGNVEGTTISATSLNAPKDARKAFEKGHEAIKKQKWEDARAQLEKAVAAYPKYAAAWYDLGTVYEQSKQIEDARKAYGQSLAADAKFVNPYLRLAALSAAERKWQDVADTTDRMLKLNPLDFPMAYFFNAVANYNLQKMDAAEKSVREVVKLDSQHRMPKAHHLLGVILAQKQDLTGAREYLTNYLKFAPDAPEAEAVRKDLGNIEKTLSARTPAQQQ